MVNLKFKSLKGMHDYLPDDLLILDYIENIFKKIIISYSFSKIKFPIMEDSDLFKKINNYNSNIFSKEMYSFFYKNKKNISLRPEGTICCLRLYLQNKLFLDKLLNKFWYIGSMFRCENTQKGRYREFNQIGLESYGSKSFFLEIELLLILKRLWSELNINNYLTLEINTLGDFNDRKKYYLYIKNKLSNLIDIRKKNKNNINYLKLINSDKIKCLLNNNIPKLINFVNEKSLLKFKYICNKLDVLNIKYTINYSLFRGIDYYNDFVFEWKNSLDVNKNNTVCAGGRYDLLSSYISNISIPAVGCAIGLERLLVFFKKYIITKCNKNYIYIYIISSYNNNSRLLGLIITENIVNYNIKNVKVYNYNISYKKLNNIIREIIKKNARILIIIGKKEIYGNYITVKDLYKNKLKRVKINNLLNVIIKFLNT